MYTELNKEVTVCKRVKVSYILIAVKAVEVIESHCILGTANERRSSSLSSRCRILYWFKNVQSSHGVVQPRTHDLAATYSTIFKPLYPLDHGA